MWCVSLTQIHGYVSRGPQLALIMQTQIKAEGWEANLMMSTQTPSLSALGWCYPLIDRSAPEAYTVPLHDKYPRRRPPNQITSGFKTAVQRRKSWGQKRFLHPHKGCESLPAGLRWPGVGVPGRCRRWAPCSRSWSRSGPEHPAGPLARRRRFGSHLWSGEPCSETWSSIIIATKYQNADK